MNKPLIFLMGPTASGKTSIAIQLAKEFPIEIVSVDSALIYKGMDIGTGKPSPTQLIATPHHLIDIREPNESYSAAEFREDAFRIIKDIHARNHIPLLVGGTMMYFHTLKYGLSALPNADPEIRAALEKEKATIGLAKLHERLQTIDPIAAKRIHPNDPQRLLRALEVYEITGKSLSDHLHAQTQAALPYKLCEYAIFPTQREILHQHIADRFEAMLAHGFIAEVARLQQRGDLDLSMPSMRSVGYRQIWQYLLGEFDENTMKDKVLAATRQLAKRQLTWLRSWEDVCLGDANVIMSHIKNKLKEITEKNV